MPISNDSSPRPAVRPAVGAAHCASSDCMYIVQLHVCEGTGVHMLVGRLEHVMSGRRHDFDSGAALLGCLEQEQTHVLATRAAKR